MNILLFLLLVLKIVGIILLIIIVALIVLIAIILFVPIKYNLEAEKSDKLYFDIEVAWLFKVIYFRYRVSYKSKKVIFKMFGKTFFKNKETFEELEEEVDYEEIKHKPTPERHDTIGKNSEKKKESSPQKRSESKEKIPSTKRQKEKSVDKVIDKVVEDKIEDLGEIFEESLEEQPVFHKIKEIWNYPDRKKIIQSSLRLIKKVIKALIPDRLVLDIEYGGDNPAHTGYVLAFSSILVLCFGDNVKVRGNFQKEILNGKVKSSGRVFMVNIVRPLLIFLLSRPIFKIIWKYIKKRKD